MNEIHKSIGKATQSLGGHLKCESCGTIQELGNVGNHIKNGWPKCCRLTMTWKTQKQLDDDLAPIAPKANESHNETREEIK